MNVPSKKNIFLPTASYCFIVFAGVMFYFRTFFFGFTYFDDSWFVLDACRKLTEAHFSLWSVFAQTLYPALHADQFYRPFVSLSYLMNAWLGGMNAFVYHFTNIVFHVASSCFVYAVIYAMRYGRKRALLAGLIFMMHPLQQQVAVSITGRNDSLLAIFVLPAFLIFIKLLEKPTRARFVWYNVLFLASLCTKESAIGFIPVCFVYAAYVSQKRIFCRRSVFIALGWLIVLCVWLIARHLVLRGIHQFSIPQMLLYVTGNAPVILVYLGNVLFPVHLSVWPTLRDSTLVYGVVTVVAIAGSLILSRNARKEYIVFGAVWFLCFLLPTLVRPNQGAMAYFLDQRMYLPLVGLFILFLETDIVNGVDFKKISHSLAVVSCTGVLLLLSYFRTLDFKDSVHFWENARQTSPHTWRSGGNPDQVEITVK